MERRQVTASIRKRNFEISSGKRGSDYFGSKASRENLLSEASSGG